MDLQKMKWSKRKPKFNQECLLITASEIRGEWEYRFWIIVRADCDEGWYWAITEQDGEEWGALEDLTAQRYCVIQPLKPPQP